MIQGKRETRYTDVITCTGQVSTLVTITVSRDYNSMSSAEEQVEVESRLSNTTAKQVVKDPVLFSSKYFSRRAITLSTSVLKKALGP